jgi:N-acetylmuramoyl-L-alanine amidase
MPRREAGFCFRSIDRIAAAMRDTRRGRQTGRALARLGACSATASDRFFLVSLFLLPLLGTVAPPRAEAEALQVTAPSGAVLTYPIYTLRGTRHVAINHFSEMLRAVDPEARIRWNATTGVYEATALGVSFSLFREQSVLICNNALIETREPLAVARGQVFVPLDSLDKVLQRFENVRSNISELAASTVPAGPDASEAERGPNALQPVAPTPTVDFKALFPLSAPTQGSSDTPQPDLERDLRHAVRPLVERDTIVIDPQPPGLPERADGVDEGNVGADLTLRVAERCRDILASRPGVTVVLTRESETRNPSVPERLKIANSPGAKALVCLRMDASPFPDKRGFRLYTVHEAVDPEGRRYHGRQDIPGALPQSSAYLPYQNVSLVLAQILEAEMTRGGLATAPAALRLAPFYLLKRAAAPSVSISLGYLDQAGRFSSQDEEYLVNAAASSLAQGLLYYNSWIEEMAGEAP